MSASRRRARLLLASALATLCLGAAPDPARNAFPPPAPRTPKLEGTVLFADDFSSPALKGWKADREGVWSVHRGVLRADLPDGKQQRSLVYAGSEDWSDYTVDLDAYQIRGVDKGVVVRALGQSGVGVDLRGPGYQDLIMYRREFPLGKAKIENGSGAWQHLRVEARGDRYRVWVNGQLVLEHGDRRNARPFGRIALAAYTGGVGECTVYYDNVVVTAIR